MEKEQHLYHRRNLQSIYFSQVSLISLFCPRVYHKKSIHWAQHIHQHIPQIKQMQFCLIHTHRKNLFKIRSILKSQKPNVSVYQNNITKHKPVCERVMLQNLRLLKFFCLCFEINIIIRKSEVCR